MLALLYDSIGQAYLRLGLVEAAEPAIRQALDLRRADPRADAADIRASFDALILLHRQQGRFDLALALTAERDGWAAQIDRSTRSVSPAPAQPSAALTVRSETPLPAGALLEPGSLLVSGGQVLLRAGGGLFRIDPDGRSPPGFQPLATDETLIGLSEAFPGKTSRWILQRGDRVVAQHVGSAGLEESVLLTGLGEQDRVLLDASGQILARLAGDRIRLHEIGDNQNAPVERILDGFAGGPVWISRRSLAYLGRESRLRAIDWHSGAVLLDVKDWQGRVQAVAIDDFSRSLAVGGWFDELLAYDLDGGLKLSSLTVPGQARGLLAMPDHPSLLAAKGDRIVLMRDGKAAQSLRTAGADYLDLQRDGADIFALDGLRRTLVRLGYRSGKVQAMAPVSGAALWALASDAEAGRVWLGGADGGLHQYDLATGTLRSARVHSQGLTAIRRIGSSLVTASDDKTIALWSLPDLQLVQRSQAHAWLVNALHWDAGDGLLWSASSDGSLSSWRLPALERHEQVVLSGGSKSALWIDAGRGVGLVGTWNGSWQRVQRIDGAWQAMAQRRVVSDGVYVIEALPALDLAALQAVRPGRLFLETLDSGEVFELPLPHPSFRYLAALGSDRLVAVGSNMLAGFRLQRDDDQGRIRFQLSVLHNPDIGEGDVVAALGDSRLVVGSGAGDWLVVETAEVVAQVLADGEATPVSLSE